VFKFTLRMTTYHNTHDFQIQTKEVKNLLQKENPHKFYISGRFSSVRYVTVGFGCFFTFFHFDELGYLRQGMSCLYSYLMGLFYRYELRHVTSFYNENHSGISHQKGLALALYKNI
jgi:hypothetical protein